MKGCPKNAVSLFIRYDDPEQQGERVQVNYTPGEYPTARRMAQDRADEGRTNVALLSYTTDSPVLLERFAKTETQQNAFGKMRKSVARKDMRFVTLVGG